MIISSLFAAAFTFTATATGLEKGAPVEFMFVDKTSDRDYEALFIIDRSQAEFRRDIEKAGLKPGKSVNIAKCVLWPVGCKVKIEPTLDEFVNVALPEGYERSDAIYTGGHAGSAVFTFYSLSESPIVFNGVYPQGDVYNAYTVKRTMKKGEKREFTISWNETDRPTSFVHTVTATNVSDIIRRLRSDSSKGEIDVRIDLDPELTYDQAVPIANALNLIDSNKIKIHGVKDGCVFYKAFLPKVAWLSRKDRLLQPFELTLGESPDKDKLVFIEEDWTVEGDDPALTLKTIPFADAAKHEKTDTCFIFVNPQTKIARIESAMAKLKGTKVKNWYIFKAE